jgi:phospholipase/carboxylesterase
MASTPTPSLPAAGPAEQLMIVLHGVGASGAGMAPVSFALRGAFPQAVLLTPDGFDAFDMAPAGRQWFSVRGITEANRVDRVAAVLPQLIALVRDAQAQYGVGPAATALVGFSQGAILALALSAAEDGLVGRVLAFAGRYPALPAVSPKHTTIHFFHGEADPVIPVMHARTAFEHLERLQGDATIDIASGVGHEITPALLGCAIDRLRSHIPHRTWARALGSVRGLGERGDGEEED